jgi:hypothetical protein
MKYLFLFSFLLISILSTAQGILIEGIVLDSANRSPLPNAHIAISAGNFKQNHLTNTDGQFSIKVFRKGEYTLEVNFLGYKKYELKVNAQRDKISLGQITLQPDAINLGEVSVVGYNTPVVQKGDTTEMSADSYKVNQDADGLDLVKKMPGITVENGKVKAQGEELKKVLVDGKEFFGEDVNLSLQNLPADMIEKVQVFNKLSDQAEFTGFDDGNSERVMNIITRPNRRKGTNGKFNAGYGPENVYQFGGRLNITGKVHNLTLTGGSNNINQQNFSGQDMFQSGGGGRSAFFGRMGGLNTTHSMGINYSGIIGPRLKMSASYFFNGQINETENISNRTFFGDFENTMRAKYEDNYSLTDRENYNHRLNLNLEYTIDSFKSITYRQNLSFQQNESASDGFILNYTVFENPMLQTFSESLTNSKGYNYWGNLVYRQRFLKKGRTFSLGLQLSGNQRDVDNSTESTSTRQQETIYLDQNSISNTNGLSYSANFMFTEPINEAFLMMVSYNAEMNPSRTEKFVYDDRLGLQERIDSISNKRESNFFTQRAGLTLLIQKGKDLNASAGIEYQFADLFGDQTFPFEFNTDKTFRNILPNARIDYKISKKTSIRANYRTSTNAPSVTQLQPVIDITNSSRFSLGNPNLIPAYSHRVSSNFRYANSEKFTNLGFNVFGNYTLDPIGNQIRIMEKDTVIYGQRLLQNGQLSSLVNLPDSYSFRGFLNYGFLFKPIKCNITLMAGGGYSSTPGIVNMELGETKTTDVMQGIVIASNISQFVDFTLSYQGNFAMSENQIDTKLNSNTWRHTIGLSSTLSTKNGFVLSNSLSNQIIRGLGADFNQDYLLWNFSFGKKIFKNKSGQIAIQINDILDQNTDISRSVTDYFVADSRSNTLGRHGMVVFTYTLRSFSSKPAEDPRFGPRGGHDGPRMMRQDGGM